MFVYIGGGILSYNIFRKIPSGGDFVLDSVLDTSALASPFAFIAH